MEDVLRPEQCKKMQQRRRGWFCPTIFAAVESMTLAAMMGLAAWATEPKVIEQYRVAKCGTAHFFYPPKAIIEDTP